MVHGPSGRGAGTVPTDAAAAASRSSAPRACSISIASSTCSSSVAPAARRRTRSTAITFTGPTQVGEPSSPQGPSPRSAAPTRVISRAGTAARPGGSTLVGSVSRSAHESIAGSRTSASTQPSSSSQRAKTRPPSIVNTRTPVRNGTSRSSAISGPTCPVSASTELRPVSTRSNAPACASAAASAFAVASVSEPAKAGSVTCTPVMSTSRSSPHAIASRNVSSAGGGPRVNTTTDEPGRSPASSHAFATARRQYGFISSSTPSRRRRPSSVSSISSNFGICLTRTAMRTAVLRLAKADYRVRLWHATR